MNEMALQKLNLPLKALFTGYLLAIGLGLLMAGTQIMPDPRHGGRQIRPFGR